MNYKELDPTIAAKAIEGYQDALSAEAKGLEAFYRQFRCQHCRGACVKETVANHAFSDDQTLTPRSCLRCTVCRCLFDPHSGLLLEGPAKK